MRTIKFRAWDKDKQRMIVVPNLHFGDDGSARTTMILLRTPEGSTRTLVAGENCELMQFTGSRDMQCRDIYEGDIVRWDYKGLDYIRVVRYDEIEAMFHPNDMYEEVEVIGNIYANPELLKSEDAA